MAIPMLAVDVELATRQRDRFVERGRDAFGELDRLVHVLDVLAHDDELVAAEARHGVGRANGRRQAARHLDQQLVADHMAEAVVDELEAVEVEEEHRDAALRALGVCERVREAVDEQQAVGEAREVVVDGLVRERLLGALAVRDVAHLHEVVARLVERVAHDGHVDEHRDDAAVGPDQAVLALIVRLAAAQEAVDPRARALDLGGMEELQGSPPEQPVDGVPQELGERGIGRGELLLEVEDGQPERGALEPLVEPLLGFESLGLGVLAVGDVAHVSRRSRRRPGRRACR